MRKHSWISNCFKLQIWGDLASSYLSRIYRITYFNPFKNMLGKLDPFTFFSLYHQTDYWLLVLRMTFFNRICKKKKVSNIWYHLKKKLFLSVLMITLKKLVWKSVSSPPFKKTHLYTIRPPSFYNLSDFPSEGG